MKSLKSETYDNVAVPPTATWIAVVRTYNECTATLTDLLAPLGVSLLQHEILINLFRSPGLTQQQLAKRCFSAKSGISMLVARFVEEDLIKRAPAPKDQRAWSLSLTEKGQTLAKQVVGVQNDVVAEMAKAYSPDDLLLVKDIMDRSSVLLENLRDRSKK
jgi:DNA-binding MarR family transcriptional regulator